MAGYGIQTTPKTSAELKRAFVERDREIDEHACENPARRRRLEKNMEAWLKWYKPDDYSLAFSPVHRQILAAALRTLQEGTGMVVAAPRGFGKSTLLGDVALYGVLTGLCSFPVVVAWEHRAAKKMLRGWLEDVCTNERLQADYGTLGDIVDACGPFRAENQGKAIRNLTWRGGELCGADIQLTDSFIVLPGKRILIAGSIKGSLRGLRVKVQGKWIRPDVVFLDDPQDEPTALSEILSAKVIDRIDHDLRSLSGPAKRLSVMAAVTVISDNDVAERLLERRDMESIRMGQVVTWPKGWTDKGSETRALWDEWNEIRLDNSGTDGDGGKACRAFYRKHKKAMKAGFRVSWPARYDRERKDPDAYFATMLDYYVLTEGPFMAERQNQPLRRGTTVYDLTPEIVMSRIDESRKPFEVPDGFDTMIAATDINNYGLHSVCVAFRNDQTAAVVWYGRFDKITVPENAPQAERKRIIYEMLVAHGKQIDGLQARPGLWIIDGGYEHEMAQRYVTARATLPPAIVARGYAADRYRPWGRNVIGKAREECHHARWPLGHGLAWNADYWREISQRGWLGSVGAPGACSLYPGQHRDFAEQVTREKLGEKLEGRLGMVWRWLQTPGKHDYGDSMAMAYAGAAWQGVGTGGQERRARRPSKRRVRHVPV